MENNKYGWSTPPEDVSSNYIKKCKMFCESDEHFKNFRQDSDYKVILEGYDDGGPMWLSMILDKHGDSILKEKLESFKRNDVYGNPTIKHLDIVGDMCPFTLKYIGNALDILKETNQKKFKKIVEVGVGFGSMCLTMDSIFDFDEYILIDLPEVICLSKKYLMNFPELYKKTTFISCDNLIEISQIKDVDLFISDSALCECNYETQLMYFEKIIKNSNFGYIVYHSNLDLLQSKLNEVFTKKIENNQVNYLYLKNKLIS